MRFLPAVQRLRRLVADGYAGTPLYVTLDVATPRQLDRRRAHGWWEEKRRGGGALGAYGSHAVDLVRVLLGEPDAVCGTMHTFLSDRIATGELALRRVDADDWAALWLRAGPTRAVIQVSAAAHGGGGLRLGLFGTDGALHIDTEGGLRGRRGAAALEELSAPAVLPEALRGRVPDTPWSAGFVGLARAVTDAIEAGARTVPGAATFEDGLAVQRVLDAVRAGSDAGWIQVAPS
jgi:predicted dehydrogenase